MAEMPTLLSTMQPHITFRAQLPGPLDHAPGRSDSAAFHELDDDAMEMAGTTLYVCFFDTALIRQDRQRGMFVHFFHPLPIIGRKWLFDKFYTQLP